MFSEGETGTSSLASDSGSGTTNADVNKDNGKITFLSSLPDAALYFDKNSELENYRRSAEHTLCDLKLSFDGQEPVFAHRTVLFGASSYFKEKFVSISKDDLDSNLSSEFAEFCRDRETVDSIISFLYTGRLEVNVNLDTLEKLFTVAKRLRIADITVDTCSILMQEAISVYNCWIINKFAEWHELHELRNRFLDWLNVNVLENGNVMDLNSDQIGFFVANARSKFSSTKIFKAIMAWVSHSENDRNKHLYGLISQLDLASVLDEAPNLLRDSYRKDWMNADKRLYELFCNLFAPLAFKNSEQKLDNASTTPGPIRRSSSRNMLANASTAAAESLRRNEGKRSEDIVPQEVQEKIKVENHSNEITSKDLEEVENGFTPPRNLSNSSARAGKSVPRSRKSTGRRSSGSKTRRSGDGVSAQEQIPPKISKENEVVIATSSTPATSTHPVADIDTHSDQKPGATNTEVVTIDISSDD